MKFQLKVIEGQFEEIVKISIFSNEHLQDEEIGPRIISAFKKPQTEKRMTAGFYLFLKGYARSPFGEFNSNLRIVVGRDEDDFQLNIKQYNSNFVTYELLLGIYTNK